MQKNKHQSTEIMKRLSFAAFLMMLTCLAAQATISSQEIKTLQNNIYSIIENFNHEMPCQQFAEWYVLTDVDGDGHDEMVIANIDKTRVAAFKITNDQVRRISNVPTSDISWSSLFYFFSSEDINHKIDPTLKFRPLFLNKIQISKNRFTTDNGTWNMPGMGVDPTYMKNYNRMIFKSHVNNAKYVGVRSDGKNGLFTWSLTNAALTKKMFRGYSDYQATPFIVPQEWLNEHNVLEFSRWLNGEKEKKATSDAQKLISNYYGGKQIIATKWIASCPDSERSFYMILFAPEQGYGLMAMVCIAEGEVISAYNNWIELEKGQLISTSGEDYSKEMFFHAPQIMAMVATQEGLELYVRWNSLEGIHYSIWREYCNQWIQILDDYEYLAAY